MTRVATSPIDRALRLWATGIVHRQDHFCDEAVDLLRRLTLADAGDGEAATQLGVLLIRRASAWANREWSWSNDWIDHYPYDSGDPEGDEDLDDDYFQPWPDVIAYRDDADRLLTGVLTTTPTDCRAAMLKAVLWYDRWVAFRMLSQELPDDTDVQATGDALLEQVPVVLERAERLCGSQRVTTILRVETGSGAIAGPGRWSWYLLRRGHVWHANGELVDSFLVTTDPDELRWAHDAWSATEPGGDASFALDVYRSGEVGPTVDLADGPLPTPLPELVGDPLPFGLPAVASVNDVPLILHNGYSMT